MTAARTEPGLSACLQVGASPGTRSHHSHRGTALRVRDKTSSRSIDRSTDCDGRRTNVHEAAHQTGALRNQHLLPCGSCRRGQCSPRGPGPPRQPWPDHAQPWSATALTAGQILETAPGKDKGAPGRASVPTVVFLWCRYINPTIMIHHTLHFAFSSHRAGLPVPPKHIVAQRSAGPSNVWLKLIEPSFRNCLKTRFAKRV